MNHNEIETCVMMAKTGSNEHILKIIEQFKPYIIKTAAEYNIKFYDINDLIQIGCMALFNAVAKYKTGSHTFSSYAYIAIKNEFRYAARRNSKYNDEVSLNMIVDNSDEICTEYVDCLEALDNLEEDFLLVENARDIKKAVSKLTKEEIELITLVYYKGITLLEFAEKAGISYQQAIRRRKRAFEKLSLYIREKRLLN